MKSVLLSTRPKWCEKICHKIGTDKNGKPIYEKSIEARKTKPSIPTPFKAFIYMTKKKPYMLTFAGNGKMRVHNGMVIGEFICDKISKYPRNYEFGYEISEKEFNETALTAEQFVDYGKGKTLYGWHISQLKIYDKPKELSEFFAKCRISDKKCRLCNNCFEREDSYGRYYAVKKLTRPPQSWCYVQE